MKIEKVPREKKILFWLLLVMAVVTLFIPLTMHGQEISNTYHVSQFAGPDKGTKMLNAQASCSPNTSIPCVIVIDAIMAVWPTGNIPSRCSQCIWLDYSTTVFTATPISFSAATQFVINGSVAGSVTVNTVASAGANTATFPAATGNVVLDTATQALLNKTLNSPVIVNGIGADGSGYKHKRFSSLCTTTASAGASCITAVTWTTAFADANYTLNCSGLNAANNPIGPFEESKAAAGFTIRIFTAAAVASSLGEVDCTATHD